jgi:hypothetical protein
VEEKASLVSGLIADHLKGVNTRGYGMISQVLVEIVDFCFEGFTGHTVFLENSFEFLLEL